MPLFPLTTTVTGSAWAVEMLGYGTVTFTVGVVFGAVTVTVAEPFLVESSVDVAVTVALPAADGVNTPLGVTAPPVADQVTVELKPPVPETVAEHWLVWFV